MTVEDSKKHLRSGENSMTVSDAGSSTGASASTSTATANPFGTTVDPRSLKGKSYTAASTIIAQSVYAISSKIFSYETTGADDLLDSHLQLWSQNFKRTNSFGIVPFFHKFQVRSGASSAILGYFSKNGTNGQPVSVFAAANTLTYMKPTLALQTATLPLSFNVSAIDFDEESNTLVSNYIAPLSEARTLNYPVLTPVSSQDGLELQHLAVLNHYLAFLTGRPSVNLFDGPEFAKTFTKFTNLLSVDALGELYENLLASSKTSFSSIDQAVDLAFANLNELTGKSYSQFEYIGSETPESVFVIYGSHESTVVSDAISKLNGNVGLIKIRVPVPFNQEKFIAAIPKSTKKLIILGQVKSTLSQSSSSLKADITAALFLGGVYNNLNIDEFSYPLDFNWTPITVSKILLEYLPKVSIEPILKKTIVESSADITANTSPQGSYLIWGRDDSILVDIANKLALSLSLDDSKTVSIRNKYDNTSNGGLFQSQIVSEKANANVNPVDSADVVIIDETVLNSYDIVATAKPGAKILLISQKTINSLEDDIIAKLPIQFKRSLAKNHNSLTMVDFSTVEELDAINDSTKGFSGEFLVQVAFWKAAFPEVGGFVVNKLLQANGNGFELLGAVLDKFVNCVEEKNCLKEVPVSAEWATLEDEKKEGEEEEEEPVELGLFPSETSFVPNERNSNVVEEETNQGTYVDVATKLAFPEAYSVSKQLRPDLPVKNFVVKVQENKRLTPTEYSRNIFHIEFDITGTGLTYDIGEALGVHSRNNAEEVEKFLAFYGVDGDSIVEVSNKDEPSILEVRSARQALLENVDFLGKPPKRFYESLAEFATNEKEKKHLETLAGSAGAEELKKRQDVDFCTYVDILEEFKSARPSFVELIKFIAPMKRREYSIASSQKLHPNAVHLLIVVVDWVDPKGRTRYGQCSKYLSDLNIGDELVVSVKPSVMKLPPLTTQPIVMSGLGTGLAPFKAFIEEKIWQQQQGHEIGEIYLYMGSRHKKEEYLYGELWEAYIDAGILTHIGAAFSRDQPQKIYIQDKIRESIDDLVDAIVVKNGSFYLCGPTWPVPDITACLEDIVVAGGERTGAPVKDAAKVVEDMKEDGRYILEVY